MINVDQTASGSSQGVDSATLGDSFNSRKHPLESAEDLMSILKTAYPLLALTMENAMEHIVHRLRSNVEEDFLRVLTSLITESYQHIMNRVSGYGTVSISQASLHMEASLKRVFSMICNSNSLGPVVLVITRLRLTSFSIKKNSKKTLCMTLMIQVRSLKNCSAGEKSLNLFWRSNRSRYRWMG